MRKIIPFVVIAVGLGLVAFSFLSAQKISTTPSFTEPRDTSIVDDAKPVDGPQTNAQNPPPQTQPTIPEKIISPEIRTITISIAVRQATSTLQIPEGSSVYEAMKILASTTAFRFHSTYYSGMGYFIDEINDEKNRNNAFWVYYVNGAQASVGAGMYVLKNGDTIRWRLEDSAKKEVGIQ